MGSKYTDSQKRATAKFLKANYSSLSIRIKPEQMQMYKNAADVSGVALRQFVISALEEKIARDGLKVD